MIVFVGNCSSTTPEDLLNNTKLSTLTYSCYNSKHATAESQQKAVHLSACAVAHSDAYKALLPHLERILWTDQRPNNQSTAAAGGNCNAGLNAVTALECILSLYVLVFPPQSAL